MSEADTLRMAAEITDKFSAPLRNMTRSLKGFSDNVNKTHAEGIYGAKEHLKHFRELDKTIKETGSRVRESLSPAFEAFGLGALSAAGGIAAVAAAVKNFVGMSRDLSFVSKETGIAIQQLRIYGALAESVGSSSEAMSSGLQTFAANMAQFRTGRGSLAGWFDSQLPSTRQFGAQLRGVTDNAKALSLVIEALGKIQDEQQKRVFLQALGLPIELARKSAKEFADEYEEINRKLKPLTPKNIADGKAAAKTFDDLALAAKNLKTQLGADLGPAVEKLSKELTDLVEANGPEFQKFFKEVGEGLEGADWKGYGEKIQGAYHALDVLSQFVHHGADDAKPLPWSELVDAAGLTTEVEKLREWMKSNSISDAMRDWLDSGSIAGALTDGLSTEIEAVKKTWTDFREWLHSNSISDSITGALKPPASANDAPAASILPRAAPGIGDQFKPLRPGFQRSAFHPADGDGFRPIGPNTLNGEGAAQGPRSSTSEAISVIAIGTRKGVYDGLYDYFQMIKGGDAGGGGSMSAIQAAYHPSNDNAGGGAGVGGSGGVVGGGGREGAGGLGTGGRGGAGGGGRQAGGGRRALAKRLGMDKGGGPEGVPTGQDVGINRDKWLAQLEANPRLKEELYRRSLGENTNPEANQAVMEEAANRADIRGGKGFADHSNLSYFAGRYGGAITPKMRKMLDSNYDKVFRQGSDISGGAIDNSSQGLAYVHEHGGQSGQYGRPGLKPGRFKTTANFGGDRITGHRGVESFEVPGWGESGSGERVRWPQYRRRQLEEAEQRRVARGGGTVSATQLGGHDKQDIVDTAARLRDRHNDIFGVHGRRNAKYGVHSTENEGGLLETAKQAGAFGIQKHSVEGNAAVHVSFSGLPAGARTKASADGMFKTVSLNRGRTPMASQDG
jgi:hypothetical protein